MNQENITEPIRIESSITDEYDKDMCSICHIDIEDELYTMPGCGHKFHNNCIISWFRTGNGSCPYCRNMAPNENDWFNHWGDRRSNYRFKRQYAKREDAPKELKKLIIRLKKAEKKQMDESKIHSLWKKSDEGKEFSRLLKIRGKYRIKRQSLMNNILDRRCDIQNYPIVPGIVRRL
jgi:hypothetical protein